MQKMKSGVNIKRFLAETEPEYEIEVFGFRYFEKFLSELDPWTQEYFSINSKQF
jgi:hypothetical protein